MEHIYQDLGRIMGEHEAAEIELETMSLNGKNHKANRYLQEAMAEIRHALSDMSDAEFEITTSPYEGEKLSNN